MTTHTFMRWTAAAAAGSVALLALAGCASGAQPGAASGADAPETIAMTIGGVPTVDMGFIQLAQDQGFFEDAGLDVTIEYAGGASALVPALLNGQYDVIWGGLLTGLRAVDQGLPLKAIALSSKSTGEYGHDLSGILALDGSGIESVADLPGKKVGVNEAGGPHEVQANVLMKKKGVDYSQVEYVELPIPNQNQALRDGTVDAVVIPDPYLTASQQQGGVTLVASTPNEWSSNLYTSAFYTTEGILASDPVMIDRFLQALHQSYDLAREDPDALRAATSVVTKIDPAILETMAFPANGWEGQRTALQEYADAISGVNAIEDPDAAKKLTADVMP